MRQGNSYLSSRDAGPSSCVGLYPLPFNITLYIHASWLTKKTENENWRQKMGGGREQTAESGLNVLFFVVVVSILLVFSKVNPRENNANGRKLGFQYYYLLRGS